MYTISELQVLFNSEIQKEVKNLEKLSPRNLYSPIKYTLDMGGKRLRPIMVLLSYNLFNDNIKVAFPTALAIEVFHNFTLLHDDIMDNSEVRRNRPTVHKIFDENRAILSGDAMSFLSVKYLIQNNPPRLNDLIKLFSQTALEVCEGQQFDMDFESKLAVTENEYLEMIRLKTAVLIACSLKSGALLANQNSEEADLLYNFGLNLGMAFQLQDDLLDSFGDEKTFGKKIGGDIVSNKKTYLQIKALELANKNQKEKLNKLYTNSALSDSEKISAVKTIFAELNIKNLTRNKYESYFQNAKTILTAFPAEEHKKNELTKLMFTMLKRVR